jgi:transposase
MVPEMDCPAQSPDLNPTEHLWDELEQRLRYRPHRPTSLTALATALQEEWYSARDIQTPGRKSPQQS